MEAPEYFHGGNCLTVAAKLPQEKQGKAGRDQFTVEDLLDFSNGDDDDAGMAAGDGGRSDPADFSTITAVDSSSNSFSGCSETQFSGELDCRSLTDTGITGEICASYEETAELEWLSNFVEESFYPENHQKLQIISGNGDDSAAGVAGDNESTLPPVFPPEAAVPGKARSKRPRSAPFSWSSRLQLVAPPSATSYSEFNTSGSQSSGKKVAKKREPSRAAAPAADGRRCLHCDTDKTPQWRTGPMGPKTLCNACGVRFKSGRLVPEYRPAASPSFVLSKHSNSHRKVLELRRQKELQQQYQQQLLNVGSAGCIYNAAAAAAAATTVADDFLIHQQLGTDFRQLI
ncbi:GATA transcription factor 12 [Apostasia shenzhenica]|uniref:GATA transcription factor n=1 Tax=Apostasia shenzhenica TaxID=1088818 RepID=A0A2I0BC13_9ASPA|nr:GATA transcription factor 12 [Apostasia shenzhenica]